MDNLTQIDGVKATNWNLSIAGGRFPCSLSIMESRDGGYRLILSRESRRSGRSHQHLDIFLSAEQAAELREMLAGEPVAA